MPNAVFFFQSSSFLWEYFHHSSMANYLTLEAESLFSLNLMQSQEI